MSQTLPRAHPHASLASASIGARLNLEAEAGAAHAKLLWFVILSHTPWESLIRPTWATNETLAHESGLPKKKVRAALIVLREAGMLTTPIGERPRAKRKTGRLLVPRLGSPVKVLIPDRGSMTNLWLTCREACIRPAALVTLVVGMHALAASEAGKPPKEWTRVPGKLADVRRFVGVRKSAAWFKRVRDLEALGILHREDGEPWLAPPVAWDQTARAMATVQREARTGSSYPVRMKVATPPPPISA